MDSGGAFQWVAAPELELSLPNPHFPPFIRFKDSRASTLVGDPYINHDNGTLEIHAAQPHNSGKYTCVASNDLGIYENHIYLEVKGEDAQPGFNGFNEQVIIYVSQRDIEGKLMIFCQVTLHFIYLLFLISIPIIFSLLLNTLGCMFLSEKIQD